MKDKYEMQSKEYAFPYHYIPEFEGFLTTKTLRWGIEYLSYLKYIADYTLRFKDYSFIDVGCGDGRFCQILYRTNGTARVKGIDLDERAIQWAKLFNPTIEFECKDVREENEYYDVVTLIEVIEHIPDDAIYSFLNEVKRILSDNGRILILVPSKNVPVSEKHYRHYDKNLLEQQLNACGLEMEECNYIVPNVGAWNSFVLRFVSNKFWTIEMFNYRIWKKYWKNGLVAKETNGSHVFACVKKSS